MKTRPSFSLTMNGQKDGKMMRFPSGGDIYWATFEGEDYRRRSSPAAFPAGQPRI
jgi:hypothetical protein